MGGANVCGHRRWGLRWDSLWGHGMRDGGEATWARWAPANAATGAIGGTPDGATKRARGAPN
eukprot:7240041-Pyramimonas_sp.AAC.1